MEREKLPGINSSLRGYDFDRSRISLVWQIVCRTSHWVIDGQARRHQAEETRWRGLDNFCGEDLLGIRLVTRYAVNAFVQDRSYYPTDFVSIRFRYDDQAEISQGSGRCSALGQPGPPGLRCQETSTSGGHQFPQSRLIKFQRGCSI
jgi:hypothetical protein